MRLLIIGKTGQLGAELFVQAKNYKHTAIAFSHEDLDITDFKRVERVIKSSRPEAILNTSAFHVVAECEIYPEKAFLINAIAVRNLAQICGEMNIRFITYSTDYIFDGRKGASYTESDVPNPLQVYGISKYAGEQIALQYCSNTLMIRTCGVYGGKTGSRSKNGNFVLTIKKQIIGKKTLEVASEQIVSPTYAQDLADATCKLISKKPNSGIYHLVNEGHCSWAEFAQAIVLELGSKTKIIPVDRRGDSGGARRPLFSALKNTRAKKLGVVLPEWQDALRRYIKELG